MTFLYEMFPGKTLSAMYEIIWNHPLSTTIILELQINFNVVELDISFYISLTCPFSFVLFIWVDLRFGEKKAKYFMFTSNHIFHKTLPFFSYFTLAPIFCRPHSFLTVLCCEFHKQTQNSCWPKTNWDFHGMFVCAVRSCEKIKPLASGHTMLLIQLNEVEFMMVYGIHGQMRCCRCCYCYSWGWW